MAVASRWSDSRAPRREIVQIWHDAGVKTPEEGDPDVLPIFEKYQPDAVFYHSRQRSDHSRRSLGYGDQRRRIPFDPSRRGEATDMTQGSNPLDRLEAVREVVDDILRCTTSNTLERSGSRTSRQGSTRVGAIRLRLTF